MEQHVFSAANVWGRAMSNYTDPTDEPQNDWQHPETTFKYQAQEQLNMRDEHRQTDKNLMFGAFSAEPGLGVNPYAPEQGNTYKQYHQELFMRDIHRKTDKNRMWQPVDAVTGVGVNAYAPSVVTFIKNQELAERRQPHLLDGLDWSNDSFSSIMF